MDDKLQVYLGIDPGFSGGMAVLYESKVYVAKAMDTPRDMWDWLNGLSEGFLEDEAAHQVHAAIEQQVPRPTKFFDKALGRWNSSILKSTCLLYGHFQMLNALLVAAGISHEEVTPQRWQKELGFPPGEPTAIHKNRMKARAQSLFPKVKVTLATTDALLIAHWCRLKHEGRLNDA